MKRKLIGAALVSLPLIVGGLALANAQKATDQQVDRANAHQFICPITGEELPCPRCCPLNDK